jgi:hypothetical protein
MEQTLQTILTKLDELQAQVAKLPQRKGRKATRSADPEAIEARKVKAREYMRAYQQARREKAKAAANGSAQIAA